MSNKIDAKSGKRIIQALTKLSSEQVERQNKKFWSEIQTPFSINEGLSKYPKYELDHIRKYLNITNVSHLKKADLVPVLSEKILNNFEKICCFWDKERFTLLTQAADNGGYIISPKLKFEQINYLRVSGLIYTGELEGKKILAIPSELIEPIKALKNSENFGGTIKRNTEWIKLTQGLLYYYGTLGTNQLINMLQSYTKESINLSEYLDVIFNKMPYCNDIYFDNNGFSNSRVFDSTKVKQEQGSRLTVSFYPFSKQQILTAGEPGFIDRNASYMEFVNFLTENYEVDKTDADEIVEECVVATKNGESPNGILQYLSTNLEFDTLESVQELMAKVVNLMNNTREWFLKGHTSIELSKKEKKYLQPLPSKQSNENVSKLDVGRNQPCPCGSGKKYKKCCGK